MRALFADRGETLRLVHDEAGREDLLEDLARAAGRKSNDLERVPAIDYLLDWIVEGRTVYELCCTSRSALDTGDGTPLAPDQEAHRLALAQLYVLTQGQDVPAIYFNDLLGLANDLESFEATGKPRDLNRHKNHTGDPGLDGPADPFTAAYVPLINAVLAARVSEKAFYPGSDRFEYRSVTDTVFMNHAYARDTHAIVVGNILNRAQTVTIDLGDLAGMDARPTSSDLTDALGGATLRTAADGTIRLELPPYGAVWLRTL